VGLPFETAGDGENRPKHQTETQSIINRKIKKRGQPITEAKTNGLLKNAQDGGAAQPALPINVTKGTAGTSTENLRLGHQGTEQGM